MGLELTKPEQALLRELIDSRNQIDVIFPSQMDPVAYYESLSVCCRALRHAEGIVNRIRPLIGRLMLIARDNPHLYTDKGYKNYTDFVNRYVVQTFGICASDAWDVCGMVKDFPLSLEEFEHLNRASLKILRRAGVKGSDSDAAVWLERAKTMSKMELRSSLIQAGRTNNGAINAGTVIVYCSLETQELWKEFSSNSKVKALFGPSENEILHNIIAEAVSSMPSDADFENFKQSTKEAKLEQAEDDD